MRLLQILGQRLKLLINEGGPVHSQALSLVMKRTDHCEVRGTAYWWKDFQKSFKSLSKVFVPTLTTSTQDLERYEVTGRSRTHMERSETSTWG
jgi:hypothetical protein